MKKIMNKINFAIIGLMVSVPAFAADTNAMCTAIKELGKVFNLLRTMAFIGAAFYIAGWAWGFISKPEDAKMDKIKEKGQGLLVGFFLLFLVGVLLSFIMSATGAEVFGCKNEIINFGNVK